MSEKKNDQLRSAREATPSGWFPGRAMTRTELAHLVVDHVWRHHGVESPLDRKYLAKLESGRIRFPSARYRQALRDILGAASDTELGFVSSNRARVAKPLGRGGLRPPGTDGGPITAGMLTGLLGDRPLDADAARRVAARWPAAPPQEAWLASGRRIGRDLVTIVGERTQQLRRLDDLLGGTGLDDLAAREVRATADLLAAASSTEAVARDLLSCLAELCQLAGWLAGDGGHHRDAARYYQAGVRAAHVAGDDALAGHLLSSLAYQEANVGDRRAGVRLARAAQHRAAGTATAKARALFAGRVAWTYARLGDHDQAQAALGEADEAIERSSSEPEPPWAYWMDHDEVAIMTGRCQVELGRPRQACAVLGPPVERYERDHPREYALYASWLAEAHLRAGEVDEAVHHTMHVLGRARATGSTRVKARLGRLRYQFVAYRDLPEVSDLLGRLPAPEEAPPAG